MRSRAASYKPRASGTGYENFSDAAVIYGDSSRARESRSPVLPHASIAAGKMVPVFREELRLR